ncbi:MAG: DUF938 domain-containing protein [Gammaproteobacteria bacterium]|nr:DUF938 domain-containing protein [Gammaproteobacteria bacterium]MBU1972389.1 DUF938 domain-containing protein [Gammaproteobacteria bacterium]
MPDKPCAPSCEKNRDPILAVLRGLLADRTSVLEIGSGTGQHAVHFAPVLPHLTWQTSDRATMLPGIRAWLDEAGLPNTPEPIDLDVTGRWPARRFDAVFTANTLHIMPWSAVEAMFSALPAVMASGAIFVAYGPFNYAGQFTSESNARFDASLKASAPHQGIRDFDALDALARRAGLALADDVAMPSNNRCLVWRRQA